MTSRPEAAVSLAERKRRLVADELAEAAMQLLAQKGFDAVTVDEIVAAAGVSKRTFFRYFASKEDVVVRFLADLGSGIRAELAARPADESPSLALRHSVSVPLAACADHSDRALHVVQLILRTPALHARFLERQAQWREDLTEELAARHGLDSASALYPALAAGTALTAFNTVLQHWSESDGDRDALQLIAEAFTVIAPALDGPDSGTSAV
ncbi:TetR family transcriptional regulator [Streptomyces spiroverticillatus]|uniref:TetR family transcriptional regulator n=1 Tax=Streptomyces finlayi TaxID=67296 RepID=A0A919C9R1_9ACTN|nr:TetR family transcriptional regulator [Streptomyces finlayi]GHA07220.1 TetR family transcriptional regulator [Streptomyces spiroverticillatus]GHC90647.1 TetR family transcriptional regulator [Streptomyces finlayi]